ncbi:MAG TPA: hypothetical protein VND93_27335 [Myxococcales bacterium]|jgi:hypothetical protein|nr:hypothetical protein [Myxococcales bacterium]
MNVKGVAYLARQAMVVQEFGEARWREFIDAWGKKHPTFPTRVLPVSKLPVDPFLDLQDALVKELYGGDQMALWHFGVKSGEYAITKGQLKGLFRPGETRRFALFAPNVYKAYFDGGDLTATLKSDHFEVVITGVPPHVYFEYTILGFLQGGLQALDPKAEPPKRIKGFSAGDKTVLYEVRA